MLASVVVNLFNLDGSVNQILSALGLEKVNFLGSNELFQPLLIGTDVWKGHSGYEFGLFILQQYSLHDPVLPWGRRLLDKGRAGARGVWHITLPRLMPIILLMAAVNMSNILKCRLLTRFIIYIRPWFMKPGEYFRYLYYLPGRADQSPVQALILAFGLFKSVIGMVLMLTRQRAC